MALTLSERALARAKVLRSQPDHEGKWLRVGIRGGGCSGLMYFLDWVETPDEKDRQYDFEGVPVCVDRKSYLFLNGTELDYEESLVRSAFIFNNPSAKRSCSCGESFTI